MLHLPSAGGTSGFIFDNTVQSLAGASQVYFSTLSNQTCTTSGTTGRMRGTSIAVGIEVDEGTIHDNQ